MAKDGDYDFYCDVALKPDAKIEKVYESENVLAFHHTKPSYKRHIVVISKEHIRDIRFVEDPQLLQEMITVCQQVMRSWSEDELCEKGARIITNVGKFQDSPHIHFHVVFGERVRAN